MTQGRKACGSKEKTKKDFIHFKKKKVKPEKAEENTLKVNGHPLARKTLEEKLKKPRQHDK